MSTAAIIPESKMREVLKMISGFGDTPFKQIQKQFWEKQDKIVLNACCGLAMLIDLNVGCLSKRLRAFEPKTEVYLGLPPRAPLQR